MNTQRIYQLLLSIGILTVIAFVSEKSRVLASIVVVMPLNVTIALWFISTNTGGDASLSADFARMLLFGLIPTALFILASWFGFHRGWSLGRVLVLSYGIWLVATIVYRGIEWWLKTL